MLLTGAIEPSARELLLRALGALLDRHDARGVLIREDADGLVIRARIASYLEDGGTEPLERRYPTAELFLAAVDGMLQRGSGVLAGPLERALRVLGRHITVSGWTDIVIVQDGADWRLIHESPGASRSIIETIGPSRLHELEADAIADRRTPAPQPESEPARSLT